MPTVAQTRWKFTASTAFSVAIVLALMFAGMRAIGNLGPLMLRPLLPLGFVLMAISPWVLLTAEGRREIGFCKPARPAIYLQAIVLGAAASFACFLIGYGLFGTGMDNWYVTIVANFSQTVPVKLSTLQMFLMFTIAAMIFSPIGEEIFFRGLLQRALEDRFSVRTSTWIESVAFGLVHLCHHGLVVGAAGITLLPNSAPIWFALMVLSALLFAWLRKRSGSLYPAMAAHVAFNFTMGSSIFIGLWPL
jgi:membrane protease YdiL (CAAX protease family)